MDDLTSRINELTRRIAAHACRDTALGQLYVERGRMLWRAGRLTEALGDYNEAAELDPDGPGSELAAHSAGIMDFFNPDLYNP